jgi:DNA-binding GntR family transcriptional regulator
MYYTVDRTQKGDARMEEIFKIEKPLSYYEQVYNSIKQMIFKGIFKPGDLIVESKLAEKFNVSRSPVREAIRSLEMEGLLIIDSKSRITVYQPTAKDVEDIYICREQLESLAAKLCCENATDEELSVIEITLSEAESYIENFDEKYVDTIISLNTRFHDLISEYSKNSRLQKQISGLRSLTNFYRGTYIQKRERYQQIVEEHKSIFNMIKERKAEDVYNSMKNHIQNDLEFMKI